MATAEDYRYVLTASVERLRAKVTPHSGADAYEEERQMAYFEILQMILTHAETVGMTAAEVGLADFRPGEVIGVRE